MTSKETVHNEPNRFSKSVGAGVKSLMGGGGRTYYVLEHKVSSAKHRAGEKQEIIIDYIELGRDPKCQVSFGDTFQTVSRRHAAIAREGNNWVLRQLSATNPTLINGRPIKSQWFLQNGDEIQLSVEGPKLGFFIPGNPAVSSIGFTRRLSLFRHQALRPFKHAFIALAVILVVSVGALSYLLHNKSVDIQNLAMQNQELAKSSKQFMGNIDSLKKEIANSDATRKKLEEKLGGMEKVVNDYKKRVDEFQGGGTSVPKELSLEPMFPDVYFVLVDKILLEYQGEQQEVTDYTWSGTGFLLSDGRFITARHVVESWYFYDESDPVAVGINSIVSNGGHAVAYFTAYSPDGSTLKFNTDDFTIRRGSDKQYQATDEDGNALLLTKASLGDGSDWAYCRPGKNGIMPYDASLSATLKQQDKLHILGYPLGLGADETGITPIYGNCTVSASGLVHKLIYVTDRNFEHGNSGGPVLYLKPEDQKYYAIGIVSAGAGDNTGFVIPIDNVR